MAKGNSNDPESLAMRYKNRAISHLESAYRKGLDDEQGSYFLNGILNPCTTCPRIKS